MNITMSQQTLIRNIHEKDHMRGYSRAFSRRAFTDVLKYSDYSYLDSLLNERELNRRCSTYEDGLSVIYRKMRQSYRNEYVYKNELINKWLLKHYGTRNTVYFSEFRVGSSIADLAMFNGESKAFEIKSDIDSPVRLGQQLRDYALFFDKVYIVVPYKKVEEYLLCIDVHIGVLTIEDSGRTVEISEYRPAMQNDTFDVHYAMQVLRTNEYLNIIQRKIGCVPDVPVGRMYSVCEQLMKSIPTEELRMEILKEIKQRRTKSFKLRKCPSMLRQMFLSLNLTQVQADELQKKFKRPIERL